MTLAGGCYCGAVRFEAKGEPRFRAQCHCRPCQVIAGGGPQYFMLIAAESFSYTQGAPKEFTRADKENPVTREFCAECGTHMITRRPGLADLILKAGVLDDPSQFDQPQMAIFCEDKQAFHLIPDGLPVFEKLPPS